MTEDPAYRNYWKRKRLLTGPIPRFPIARYWDTEALSDIESIYFERLRACPSLLDAGAGDLRVMRKFRAAGFTGEYHTMDIAEEFDHTYRSLDEIRRTYYGILCLDLIEHMELRAGLEIIDRLLGILHPGGVLVLQTANSRCVRHPLSWEMTHLHSYSVFDLWAYFTAMDLSVEGYRVTFGPEVESPWEKLRNLASKVLITRLLGLDYADNIAVIARKPPAGANTGPKNL